MNSTTNEERPHRGGFKRGGRRHMWKFAPLLALFIFAKAAAIMLLWNVLVPETFHGPELGYLQALELTVLAKLLLGFGGGGFRGPGPFFRGGGRGGRAMRERWATLSPEEREKFRDELQRRFE